MRLTKGKIKKLLKKKNQTKKKKHPLKRTHLNKSLKPKRKVFDVSKKTFKNRQTYGGTIFSSMKNLLSRNNLNKDTTPSTNPIIDQASNPKPVLKQVQQEQQEKIDDDIIFKNPNTEVSKEISEVSASPVFETSASASASPTRGFNPMHESDNFHKEAENIVFKKTTNNNPQNTNIIKQDAKPKNIQLSSVSSHPLITTETQKAQNLIESREAQEKHNKIHAPKVIENRVELQKNSSTNQTNQQPTFFKQVANTLKNAATTASTVASNISNSTTQKKLEPTKQEENVTETQNAMHNTDNLEEKKIADEKTTNIELAQRAVKEADNYYESALNYSKQSADLVSNAKNLLLNHPPPSPPTPAPAPAPPKLQQLNFKIEAIEYKKFLKNIDDKQYNTELTPNIELHIKFYIDKMKKENYFYDTNVGEYKVSYLYNESNNMKNIYFVMFYYKNNFGSVKDILQCLFIYNTIILDVNDMPSWITQISQNTLAKEFPSGGSPGILFYENSSKFIKDNSITLTEINASNQIQLQQQNMHMTGFIHDTRKTNYNYILYISNNIDYNNLMTQIIDPIIQPIIDSKISK